ncbi:hypothetical protein ABS767_14750 [Sphingomonas sp. ST-64]|uniref:Uncharacterized protein n=1 Tax=Sphingomonas plantiphila TaxID=3163295 RepID=A0ABW8YPS6_9SPHN
MAARTIIVIAAIEDAERLSSVGWNRWSMTARKLKTIRGAQSEKSYSFQATLSSSGCGETPLPTRGERWVLYFSSSDGAVSEALPLALAKEHDPRLKGIR